MDIMTSLPQMTNLVSQLPTVNQMRSETYEQWLEIIREKNRFHRKQWEYVYILQALHEHNLIKPGASGVGFGVGTEPIPAVLASRGCNILATEINIEKPNDKGWVKDISTSQLMQSLNDRGICNSDQFAQLVNFRDVDMNDVPSDIKGYDFTWSSCALEHLGTLKHGEEFIFKSLECLKPGGLAVHTTEYTFARHKTIEAGSTVYYRRQDITGLAERLRGAGHEITLNFKSGRAFLDWYIDIPPHRETMHVKLLVSKQWKLLVTTSIGLIIKKNPSS